MTNDSARHGQVRGFLADGYSKTLRVGTMLYQAVRDGKAKYSMVDPLLRQGADAGRANRALAPGVKSRRKGVSRQGDGPQQARAMHGAAAVTHRLLNMIIMRIYNYSRYRDYPEQDAHTQFYDTLKRCVACPAGQGYAPTMYKFRARSRQLTQVSMTSCLGRAELPAEGLPRLTVKFCLRAITMVYSLQLLGKLRWATPSLLLMMKATIRLARAALL